MTLLGSQARTAIMKQPSPKLKVSEGYPREPSRHRSVTNTPSTDTNSPKTDSMTPNGPIEETS